MGHISFKVLAQPQRFRVAIIGGGGRVAGEALQYMSEGLNTVDFYVFEPYKPGQSGLEGVARQLSVANEIASATDSEDKNHTYKICESWSDIEGCHLAFNIRGRQRKPGEERAELLKANGGMAAEMAQLNEKNPNIHISTIANPAEALTVIAGKGISGDVSVITGRVTGQASDLDTGRFRLEIKDALSDEGFNKTLLRVNAETVGPHGPSMIPLTQHATVTLKAGSELPKDITKETGETIKAGTILSEPKTFKLVELLDPQAIETIIKETKNGGAKTIRLMEGKGSATLSTGRACAKTAASFQKVFLNPETTATAPLVTPFTKMFGVNSGCTSLECTILSENGTLIVKPTGREDKEGFLTPEQRTVLGAAAHNSWTAAAEFFTAN